MAYLQLLNNSMHGQHLSVDKSFTISQPTSPNERPQTINTSFKPVLQGTMQSSSTAKKCVCTNVMQVPRCLTRQWEVIS
jgi:hypothetical protein